jgi:hypothetical protein
MRASLRVIRILGVSVALVGWLVVPRVLRNEEAAKVIAQRVLDEELSRLGVRSSGFDFRDAKKSGFDWIVTWQSKAMPSAQIGVTITPFEADVWGKPMVPSCKEERQRTQESFGEVC